VPTVLAHNSLRTSSFAHRLHSPAIIMSVDCVSSRGLAIDTAPAMIYRFKGMPAARNCGLHKPRANVALINIIIRAYFPASLSQLAARPSTGNFRRIVRCGNARTSVTGIELSPTPPRRLPIICQNATCWHERNAQIPKRMSLLHSISVSVCFTE